MAGYIKGITIEFGADTTKLNAALKKTSGALNKTQAELKQINRSLKFNPGNTTLLRQKFELLQRSVTETRAKLTQLKQMQQNMNAAGVDKNSAQYRELQREIIKTENNLKQAEGALKRFGSVGKQQALAVGNAFKTAGNKIKSAGRTITTSVSVYGMAGIYAGAKLIDMSEKQAQAEEKLASIYKNRMGANKEATKSTLELASALQQQGVIGDEVTLSGAQMLATYAKYPDTVNKLLPAMDNWLAQEKGMNATQEDAESKAKILGKALNGNAGALTRLGIKLTDAQKEILKTGTEEEKAALISDLLNKKYGDMNAELAKTDSGKIQQAKNALGDMGEEIGVVLLPAVADLATWMSNKLLPKIEKLIGWLKQHPAVAKFALAFAAIMAALGPLLIVIGGFISMIGSIISIVAVVGPAIAGLAGPIGIAIAAIAAAIAIGVLLYKNWDTIKKKAVQIWNAIKTAISTAVTAIKTKITSVFNSVKATVTMIFTSIKSRITSIWTSIKTTIRNIISGILTTVVAKIYSLKTSVTSVFTSIKSIASSIWSSIRSTAASAWSRIKSAITSPITTAKNTVKSILNKIKGFFPLSVGKIFSNLKIPHIKISGGKAPFGIGGLGTKPSISVSWYKKAMQQPYMFGNATLFGAGEKGDEMLYGRNSLLNDIAMASGGTEVVARLSAIEAILDYYLPKGQQIVMDNGALIGQVNRGLGLKL